MYSISSSSRRDFVKSLSVGLAAGAAAGGFHSGLTAIGSEKKSLGFALVGLGNLSTKQIAPGLLKTKYCHLAGVVTGTPEKEKIWADQYKIDSSHIYNYKNFDKIIGDDAIDVVYVVLPNSMHEEFTIRAAKAGKHVLCEKPMANSAAECRRMIDACSAASRQLAIGYRCQYEPHHVHCTQLLRSQELGSIKSIDAGFGFTIGDPKQWRLKQALAGGGALMDVGIYALQACRYLTGEEPISVTAQETKTDAMKFAEVDESMTWAMNFPSGLVAHCSTTYSQNGTNYVHVNTERGYVRLSPAFSYQGIQAESSSGLIQAPQVDQFATEMDEFALSIIEGRSSKVSGEEGLRDLLVIEAIYRSAREGTTVSIAS
jgi:predicted dehydrogenase